MTIESIKKLFTQHKAIIFYLFFGGGTTLINFISYAACTRLFSFGTMIATIVAWFLSILFAYITNRKWVFHSSATTVRAILVEAFAFFFCRLTTGLADIGMMWFFAVFLGYNDLIVKISANIAVVIMNYSISKWFIFKKK